MTSGEKRTLEELSKICTFAGEWMEGVVHERDEARKARDLWFARADELHKRCDRLYEALCRSRNALGDACKRTKCYGNQCDGCYIHRALVNTVVENKEDPR